ncbi:ABC transporter ATP-binding protein [Oceanotoga sp. DSM 15011]|jgi:branched-chain amino acid transport system ATP-binding protein|uniref:Amino acid/amide ABC transporter ATP-binding protein 2 (HAAT family) n=1 Tax=Oceanotoga teriensis TaxID=515440 RepID=A0AA45C992_9BACT|nr:MULTISPECIES: ABC transporter ATP-binding protein [Oceanotoga]MDN5342963.1 branched-chain amino acid transport system ATP-binding protein [Oceanotoga sp.]MDO7975306.1 ABC transporter ATP-binding protein [Oceanotoga teriensis]PWJ96638.1 amino acid/amide ABC transporter ATP-binding protein 2 (HAAT family) [Oceanotoga teriensis]UYP00191.1 ABC transporter ATP-binding protein [Oceanotoga sp. DSM 15011]
MLKVNNLIVNYGHVKAVKNISFELNKGEIVSILGSNGAGKTSTLFGMMSIVKSSSNIEFKGKDISKYSSVQKVKEGLVLCPENRRVFPELSVEENLKMGSFIRGNYSKVIKDVYDLFPILKDRKRQAAGSLSGGEQQMLAVGRAMMGEPEVLMLDEPSLGLAPVITDDIFNVLKELKNSGVSILLVEQNALKSLRISDRAYILETGNIVAQGIAKDLLNDEKVKKAYLGI